MVGQFSLLDAFSPKLNADVDQSRQANSYQTSTTSTYAPVSQFTDSRQLVLILNSAGATTNTKKADSAAASSAPSTTPTFSASPSAAGENKSPLSLPEFSLFGGGLPSALIIGGVVVGAFLLLRR